MVRTAGIERAHLPGRHLVLLAVCLAAVIVAVLAPPLAQDPAYHQFADGRALWGVPNFWNLASNVGFVLAAAAGWRRWRLARGAAARPHLRLALGVYAVAMLLTALGSAYYHAAPDNASLVWDRLPMSLAFAAAFGAVLGDCLGLRRLPALLGALALAGAGSVLYWHLTETAGAGDLRPYAVLQFLPLLLLPLLLALYGTRQLRAAPLWAALVAYLGAKLAEHADAAVLAITGLLSGHSLKHLLAALAGYCIVLAFDERRGTGLPC